MKGWLVGLTLTVWGVVVHGGGLPERLDGRIEGNLDYQSQVVPVGPFTEIEVSGGIAVEVVRAAEHAVSVRAESNILPHLQIATAGSRLLVRTEPGVSLGAHGITVSVRMPVLALVEAGGGSPVSLGPEVAGSPFQARLSGGARLRGELRASQAELSATGGSGIRLEGVCQNLVLEASGGGRLQVDGLTAATARVDLSGGAQAHVNASESITAVVTGGARLAYRGSPQLDVREMSGGGTVDRI